MVNKTCIFEHWVISQVTAQSATAVHLTSNRIIKVVSHCPIWEVKILIVSEMMKIAQFPMALINPGSGKVYSCNLLWTEGIQLQQIDISLCEQVIISPHIVWVRHLSKKDPLLAKSLNASKGSS